MVLSKCQTLVSRFEQMVGEGLVDAKFFLRNLDEAVKEQVCVEINAMYEAFDRGDRTQLDFNDSRR